jgi:hypothetical protein
VYTLVAHAEAINRSAMASAQPLVCSTADDEFVESTDKMLLDIFTGTPLNIDGNAVPNYGFLVSPNYTNALDDDLATAIDESGFVYRGFFDPSNATSANDVPNLLDVTAGQDNHIYRVITAGTHDFTAVTNVITFSGGEVNNDGGVFVWFDPADNKFKKVLASDITGSPTSDYALDETFPGLEYPSDISFTSKDQGINYFGGGEDGTTTNAAYEDKVAFEINENFNNVNYSLLDMARYPFSALYDSGFTLDTKLLFAKWLDRRPDVHITLATHAEGETLTVEEEAARADIIMSELKLHGESEEWGTSCTRAVVVGHSGNFRTGTYPNRVPMTVFELAYKRALYFGAGSGIAKNGLDYTTFPGTELTMSKNINNIFMTESQREYLWVNGVNFVQFADRDSIFFPALQTVYNPRNSVLTSERIMQIACDVTKQAQKVWVMMTNEDRLTESQFIERSNAKLLALVAGKYDNRVVVTPNAYFLPADSARGYSWVMDAIIEGNVMKTVQTVNIRIRRLVE